MEIKKYLDSTYLKTPEQASLSESENTEVVKNLIREAIENDFKLTMVRPNMVKLSRTMIDEANSEVLVGTVIDFPEGTSSIEEKIKEAQQAVNDGVDEIDFVIDYEAFKSGDLQKPKQEVLECTKFGLDNNKTVKWIIETAALTPMQIVQISALIKNVIIANFDEKVYDLVFVKSSTGFFKTQNGEPNGATVEVMKLIIENSFPLLAKASGGVRTLEEAEQMIKLGVKRIGTSSAKAILDGVKSKNDY